MEKSKKIVMLIPLTKLWTDQEDIAAERGKYLTAENIKEILKKNPVEFVIADVGLKLNWISFDKSFDFWKSEVKQHLANDPNFINLDSFPENYAYVASEWVGEIQIPIILLEKYH